MRLPCHDTDPLRTACCTSLWRGLRRGLEQRFAAYIASTTRRSGSSSGRAWSSNFPRLFGLLLRLYGNQYDFFYHLEDLLNTLAQSWIERSGELKALDAAPRGRAGLVPIEKMLGGVCYVDLFAGDLKACAQRSPTSKNWG